MARKYRIKRKSDKFYPQYRVLFLFWEYFSSYNGRTECKTFKEARGVVKRDKAKRYKKTTIIK